MKTLLFVSISLAVKADCDNDPNNIINIGKCDFMFGTGSQTLANGDSFTQDNTDDFLGAALRSAAINAANLAAGFVFAGAISQCVTITTDISAKRWGFGFVVIQELILSMSLPQIFMKEMELVIAI